MKNFKRTEFVVFDVETTGLSPSWGDRIVEIAALKVRNSKPIERFYSFVDPQREISFGAFAVNGITGEMLKGAPTSREILPRFLEFVGDAALVGHNVRFDLSFLCYELSLLSMGLKDKTVIIDTLKMARHLLPDLGRYPLWFVAQSLGITKGQQHRAMADVELTFNVFRRLIEEMGEKNIEDVGFVANAWKSKINDAGQEERVFRW